MSKVSTKTKVVSALVATAIVLPTGLVLFLNREAPITFETPSGKVINLDDALLEAEEAHSVFVSETGRETHEESRCFAVKAGQYLEPIFACGPVRQAGNLFGSYDSISVAYEVTDEGVVATVGDEFAGDYTLPVAAIAARPDGIGALPASILDVKPDASLDTIPTEAVSPEGVISGDLSGSMTEQRIESAIGQTVTLGSRSVYITEAGQATSVVIDGTAYRAGENQVITVITTLPGDVIDGSYADDADDENQDSDSGTTPGEGSGDAPGGSGGTDDDDQGDQDDADTDSTQQEGAHVVVGGVPLYNVAIPGTRAENGGDTEHTVAIVHEKGVQVGIGLMVNDGASLTWTDLTDPRSIYGSPMSAGWLMGTSRADNPIRLYGVESESQPQYSADVDGYRVFTEGGETKLSLVISEEYWNLNVDAGSYSEVPGAGSSSWEGTRISIDGEVLEQAPVATTYRGTGTQRSSNASLGNILTDTLTWTLPDGVDPREIIVSPSVEIKTELFNTLDDSIIYSDDVMNGGYVIGEVPNAEPWTYVVPSHALGSIAIHPSLGEMSPSIEHEERYYS